MAEDISPRSSCCGDSGAVADPAPVWETMVDGRRIKHSTFAGAVAAMRAYPTVTLIDINGVFHDATSAEVLLADPAPAPAVEPVKASVGPVDVELTEDPAPAVGVAVELAQAPVEPVTPRKAQPRKRK